jgi:hypothetical protein
MPASAFSAQFLSIRQICDEGGTFGGLYLLSRACLDPTQCVAYTQCFNGLRDKGSDCGSLCGVFGLGIGSLL